MKYLLILVLLFTSCIYSQEEICGTTNPQNITFEPRPTAAECPLTKSSINFVVHYQNSTQIDYVDNVLIAAEYSLERQTNEFGWPRPNTDGLLGGDSRYDIYLVNMSKYGVTHQDNYTSTFIKLKNSLTELKTKATVAHELNHAMQFMYLDDDNVDPWFWENTAFYVSELTYDFTLKLYINYLSGSNPIKNPELSIKTFDEFNLTYPYSAFLWPRFLAMWLNDNSIPRKIFAAAELDDIIIKI